MAPTILSIPATPLPSSSSSPSLSDLPTQTTSQPGALAEHQHLGMIVPNLLPLKIDYSGPAEISTYFLIRPFPAPSSSSDPTPSTPSNDVEAPPPSRLLSSFRGRQLVGQPLSFPKGYTGVILDIPAPPSSSFSSTHNPTTTSLTPSKTHSTKTPKSSRFQGATPSDPEPANNLLAMAPLGLRRRLRRLVLERAPRLQRPPKRV
jgi:hypothetical protein